MKEDISIIWACGGPAKKTEQHQNLRTETVVKNHIGMNPLLTVVNVRNFTWIYHFYPLIALICVTWDKICVLFRSLDVLYKHKINDAILEKNINQKFVYLFKIYYWKFDIFDLILSWSLP